MPYGAICEWVTSERVACERVTCERVTGSVDAAGRRLLPIPGSRLGPLKKIPRITGRSFSLERVTGIEPAWPAWKAGALPLSYTRIIASREGAF